MAVPDHGTTVSIRLGSGTGTFTNGADVSVGDHPFSVAIGDFNGDGVQDLAVAECDTASVSVLFGNGDGTGTFY